MDKFDDTFERVFGNPGNNLGAFVTLMLLALVLAFSSPIWLPIYIGVRLVRSLNHS